MCIFEYSGLLPPVLLLPMCTFLDFCGVTKVKFLPEAGTVRARTKAPVLVLVAA